MTAWTNITELTFAVKTISLAATPWAYIHALSYWFAALDASENHGKDFVVSLDEGLAPHLQPVALFPILKFKIRTISQRLGRCFKQGRQHLSCIGKTLPGINRQSFSHELYKNQTGPCTQTMVASKRPTKRPTRQKACDIFVKDQPSGKAVAAVGWVAVCLFWRDISRGAEIINRCHASLKPEANPKISQRSSAIRKQKYI